MNVLHIDSSPLAGRSVSRDLSARIVASIKERFPDVTIVSRDVGLDPPAHAAADILDLVRFHRFDGLTTSQVREKVISDTLITEAELAVIIGESTRHATADSALSSVAGHSVFNDGSIRNYQRKSEQWTIGKNFDGTGGFGPDFVTVDAVSPGGKGLHITTRLNGNTVQDANTSDMIFDVATTIAIVSECMTLDAGDIIIMRTPSGVGYVRKPPLWMKPGDVCECEIEAIGILRNTIAQEQQRAA